MIRGWLEGLRTTTAGGFLRIRMLSIIAYVPLAFDALVVELEHIADVVGYFSARRAEHDLVMFRSSAMGLGTARFLKV
jgi:hypothetical protein